MRIADDLRAMRESIELSQREFARKLTKSGHKFSYTKVRDIEEKKRSIWIDDLDAWLRACGHSLLPYLQTLADQQELDLMSTSKETIRLFKMALTLPEKLEIMHAILAGILAAELRNERGQ